MKLLNNEGDRIAHHRNHQATKAVANTLRFFQQTASKASLLKHLHNALIFQSAAPCTGAAVVCSRFSGIYYGIQLSVINGIPKYASGFLVLVLFLGLFPFA